METVVDKVRNEVRGQYETKETFDLIEAFLQKRAHLVLPGGLTFEKQIAEKTARISQRDEERGALALRLYELKNQYLFLYQAQQTRLVRQVRLIISGINSDNFLLLALGSRSLIEDAAFLSYLIREARKDDMESLRALYGRSLYSNRFFGEEGLVDAVSALALVDEHLPADIEEVKEYYNCFSDFLHPGFAGSVVVSGEKLEEGITSPTVEQRKAAVVKLLQMTGVVIKYLDQVTDDFASIGTTIEEHLQKAIRPAAARLSFLGQKAESAEPGVAAASGPGKTIFFNKKGKPWLKY